MTIRRSRAEIWIPWLLLAPFTIIVLLLVVWPLLAIAAKSFSTSPSVMLVALARPSTILSELSSLQNYTAIFADPYSRRVIWTTTLIASLVATFLTVVGIFVGYFISRSRRWAPIINIIVMFPALAPAITVCFGIVWLLGPSGPINYLLFQQFDILNEPIRFQGSITAVIVGDMALFCTLAVRMMAALFEMVDPAVEEASSSLGSTDLQTFRYVVLPTVAPGLAAVWIFLFVRTMVAYVAALVLGGGSAGVVVLPLEVFSGMQSVGMSTTLGQVCALAMVLVIATALGRAAYIYLLRRFMNSGAAMDMV